MIAACSPPPPPVADDPKIYISPSTLLAHAKNTTAEYTCPWGSCPAVLHSFWMFEKHMEIHCLRSSRRRDIFCMFETCEDVLPNLPHLPALRQHVWDVHLSRYTFGCLKLRCIEEFTVPNVDMYANHIRFDHPEIWETGIPYPYHGLEGFQHLIHCPPHHHPPNPLPPANRPLIWTVFSVAAYTAPEDAVAMDVDKGHPISPSPSSSTSPPPSTLASGSSSKCSASSCPTTPPSSDSEEDEEVKLQVHKPGAQPEVTQPKFKFRDVEHFARVPRVPNSHLAPDTLKFQPIKLPRSTRTRHGYSLLTGPQRALPPESRPKSNADFTPLVPMTVGYDLLKKMTWPRMEQRGALPPIPETRQEQQNVLLDSSDSPTTRIRAA